MKKTASVLAVLVILGSISGCMGPVDTAQSGVSSTGLETSSNASTEITSNEESTSDSTSNTESRMVSSSTSNKNSLSTTSKATSRNTTVSTARTNKATTVNSVKEASLKSFELYLPEGYADYMGEYDIAGPADGPFSIFVNINLQGKASANVSLKWETTNESSEKAVIQSFKKISETRYEAKVEFPVNYTSEHDSIVGDFVATIDGKDYKSPTYTMFYRGGGGAGIGG